MSLKDTLNMPSTEFSMRANLSEKEPLYIKRWLKNEIYDQLLTRNSGNKSFILHDGPPYANGDIHVGHAMNKILKDFIFRSKSMQGYYVPIIHGWDTHGLPIEYKMLSESGIERKNLTTLKLIDLCREYASSQVEIQAKQMERLSLLGPMKNRYLTLSPEFEALQLSVFAKMVKEGLVYRGYKPVYWSPSSESALADAEIEYHQHTSPSTYISCPVIDGKNILSKNDSLLIWTTTPWTLPANSAIAIKENTNYSLIKLDNNKNIVVATKMITTIIKDLKGDHTYEIIKTFSSDKLLGVTYKHPLFDHQLKIIYGHHVNLETGTGLVHIAPGFGIDDFIIGKKENLNLIMHINDDGSFNQNANIAVGEFWQNANKTIGIKLNEMNRLVSLKFIKHSYPHDWRTKKPVMYRATLQWFVSISGIKDKLFEAINNQDWIPAWGKDRMKLMMENRDDWCISRQRKWGVPIPVFYKDKNPILETEIFSHIESLVKLHGSRVWFEKEADELLPKKYRGQGLVKETDIMDVWFDSGTSHLGALIPNGINNGADLYLEGSDQYRGWFNSSLITGVVMTGKSPYKTAISHGFALDEKGKKMSKSLGNIIDPNTICETMGADILRLWVATTDFKADVNIGKNILKQISEIYRKWRNTFRFMLANLFDFNEENTVIPHKSEDLYIIQQLNKLNNDVIDSYNTYDFSSIVKKVNLFIISDLSTFYLDFTKDILYCEAQDSLRRRQVQTILFKIVKNLSALVAPIIPTTSEEVNDYLNTKKSVHLSKLEKTNFNYNELLNNKWIKFFELKSLISKAIEEATKTQLIKKTMEASVDLNLTKEFECLKDIDLKSILMVHEVNVNWNAHKTTVAIHNKPGEICARCWNKFDKSEIENELCPRCKGVIK